MNEIEQKAHATYTSKDFTKTDDFYKAIKESIKEGNEEYKEFETSRRDKQPRAGISVVRLPTSNSVEYKISSVGTIDDQSRTVEETIPIA